MDLPRNVSVSSASTSSTVPGASMLHHAEVGGQLQLRMQTSHLLAEAEQQRSAPREGHHSAQGVQSSSMALSMRTDGTPFAAASGSGSPPALEGSSQTATNDPDDASPAGDFASRSASLFITQRLHIDALHCIFQFLHLRRSEYDNYSEYSRFFPAVRTCKAWYAALQNSRLRYFSARFLGMYPQYLGGLCSSPLRVHIQRLSVRRLDHAYDLSMFLQLRFCLPHLVGLSVLDLSPALLLSVLASAEHRDWFVQNAFPARLEELELLLLHSLHTSHSLQLVIDALPSAAMVQRLKLWVLPELILNSNYYQQLDLTPLLQLKHLSYLRWESFDSRDQHGRSGCPMSLRQLEVIKQISSLTELEYNGAEWSAEEFAVVFREPCQLQQLRQIKLGHTEVTAEMLDDLSSLSSLTELSPAKLRPEAYSLLSRFTNVASIRLVLKHPQPSADELHFLCSTLEYCSALKSLSLQDLSNSELAELLLLQLFESTPQLEAILLQSVNVGFLGMLAAFSQLRQLSLRKMILSSLAFISEIPQLKELLMFDITPHFDPVEILSLQHRAPQLQTLKLVDAADLDEEEQTALTPGSNTCILPALSRFDYSSF
jgi:hypothetical protein